MSTATAIVPIVEVPSWFNRTITMLLKTPGIQRILGSTLTLVTVTGRVSGRSYTTPVTYHRDGDTILFVTKRYRKWWRNMVAIPEVELRLAGTSVRGRAAVFEGDMQQLPTFVKFLNHRKRDARAYGVTFETDGQVNEREARAAMPDLVIVKVSLANPGE